MYARGSRRPGRRCEFALASEAKRSRRASKPRLVLAHCVEFAQKKSAPIETQLCIQQRAYYTPFSLSSNTGHQHTAHTPADRHTETRLVHHEPFRSVFSLGRAFALAFFSSFSRSQWLKASLLPIASLSNEVRAQRPLAVAYFDARRNAGHSHLVSWLVAGGSRNA